MVDLNQEASLLEHQQLHQVIKIDHSDMIIFDKESLLLRNYEDRSQIRLATRLWSA